MRRPGIEPGSQEWESCMIPLHQRRNLRCQDNVSQLYIWCSRGRVVKAFDSKSNGVSPRRFESCRLRNSFFFSFLFFNEIKQTKNRYTATTKMPPVRIELTTPGLRDQCSTTELKRPVPPIGAKHFSGQFQRQNRT